MTGEIKIYKILLNKLIALLNALLKNQVSTKKYKNSY